MTRGRQAWRQAPGADLGHRRERDHEDLFVHEEGTEEGQVRMTVCAGAYAVCVEGEARGTGVALVVEVEWWMGGAVSCRQVRGTAVKGRSEHGECMCRGQERRPSDWWETYAWGSAGDGLSEGDGKLGSEECGTQRAELRDEAGGALQG
jgi:hypothetical protein